jgi:hypothetical protein
VSPPCNAVGAATNDAHSEWTLSYEVARPDGWEFSITGQGRNSRDEGPPRADDLFRIFHGLCLYLPLSEMTDAPAATVGPAMDTPATLAFDRPAPIIPQKKRAA